MSRNTTPRPTEAERRAAVSRKLQDLYEYLEKSHDAYTNGWEKLSDAQKREAGSPNTHIEPKAKIVGDISSLKHDLSSDGSLSAAAVEQEFIRLEALVKIFVSGLWLPERNDLEKPRDVGRDRRPSLKDLER